MSPTQILSNLLKVNPLVANVLLAGMGVFAAAAIVGTGRINSGSTLYAALIVCGFGIVLTLIAFVLSDTEFKRVLGWFAVIFTMVVMTTVFAACVLRNTNWLPPPYCIVEFWTPCADLNKVVAQENVAPTPPDAGRYKVLVQFAGALDRHAVVVLSTRLRREHHWMVQDWARGGERTPAAAGVNEVRYHSAADEAAATALASQVQVINLTGQNIGRSLDPDVAAGTLELWISR